MAINGAATAGNLIWQEGATTIQLTDGVKSLSTDSNTSLEVGLNATAGSTGVIGSGTSFAELISGLATGASSATKVLGVASAGLGALGGGANIGLFLNEAKTNGAGLGGTQTATGTFTRYARVRGSAGFTRSLHPLSRINEHYAKLAMTQRLREQGQTDALSEIKIHLETLEKERSLNRGRIQNGYEAQKVILQHTRASGCTLW